MEPTRNRHAMGRYPVLLVRALVGVTKLSAVYVRCSFIKRSAVKRFERELMRFGIPADVANRLTSVYSDMVSLNPFDYVKRSP